MFQMYAALARVLRLGSLAVCFVVIASFAMFAFGEVNGASQQQQAVIAGGYTTPAANAPPAHHSDLRRTIDDANRRVTSPFTGLTSHTHSQWLINGVQAMMALLVFGFGLGYVARLLRIHA